MTHQSISELTEEAVTKIAGENIDFSYGLLISIEQSLPKKTVVNYCCVYENQRLLAFMPVYIGLNINVNALAPSFIQRAYNWLVRTFGESVAVKAAVAGSLISDKGVIPIDEFQNQSRLANLVVESVDQLCRNNEVDLCIVKDMNETCHEKYSSALTENEFTKTYSLPTIIVNTDFNSFDQYKASLTKNGRRHCKKTLRKVEEAGLKLEILDNFDHLNEQVCGLFRGTFLKASYQFEELSPSFFFDCAHSTNPKSELVVCWRGDKIVGALMNLYIEEKIQLNKRIGMDYSQADTGLIYMALNYYGIISGIKHKAKNVYLGQSTYTPKTRLGGVLQDQFLYIKAYRNYLKPSVKFAESFQQRYQKENVYQMLAEGKSL